MTGLRLSEAEYKVWQRKAGWPGSIVYGERSPAAYPPPPTAQQIADRLSGANRMNKTERAYAEYLTALGVPWQFEAVKLRIAEHTWYTPDFYLPTRAEFREVKGFWRDDAKVKFKAAAELFPQWRFTAVRKVKDGWEETR